MRAASILFISITSLAYLSGAARAQDAIISKPDVSHASSPAIEGQETYDVTYGTFEASKDYDFKRTGTKDSFRGTLARKSDGFVITFDIGLMAGIHISDRDRENYTFCRSHRIGDAPALTGIERATDSQRITTTISFEVNSRRAPANFWADIRKDSDIADFLLIVTTYRSKSK